MCISACALLLLGMHMSRLHIAMRTTQSPCTRCIQYFNHAIIMRSIKLALCAFNWMPSTKHWLHRGTCHCQRFLKPCPCSSKQSLLGIISFSYMFSLLSQLSKCATLMPICKSTVVTASHSTLWGFAHSKITPHSEIMSHLPHKGSHFFHACIEAKTDVLIIIMIAKAFGNHCIWHRCIDASHSHHARDQCILAFG